VYQKRNASNFLQTSKGPFTVRVEIWKEGEFSGWSLPVLETRSKTKAIDFIRQQFEYDGTSDLCLERDGEWIDYCLCDIGGYHEQYCPVGPASRVLRD
jgi:hypothetical protein